MFKPKMVTNLLTVKGLDINSQKSVLGNPKKWQWAKFKPTLRIKQKYQKYSPSLRYCKLLISRSNKVDKVQNRSQILTEQSPILLSIHKILTKTTIKLKFKKPFAFFPFKNSSLFLAWTFMLWHIQERNDKIIYQVS